MTAVKNKPLIFKYASYRLRNDKEVVLAALNKNKNDVIDFISPELLEDDEIKALIN